MTANDQRETLGALSQQTAAWLLGVAPRTLREKDAPRNSDGTYNARTLIEWFFRRGKSSGEDPIRAAAIRREAARADLEEMKRDGLAGRLVDRGTIESQLAILAGRLRKLGESMGRRKSVAGREVQRQLNEVINGCQWSD